jgi:hypothetical protein
MWLEDSKGTTAEVILVGCFIFQTVSWLGCEAYDEEQRSAVSVIDSVA